MLTANNGLTGSSSVSVPATTYPPASPSISNEDEPNDTFYDASFTPSELISGPVDSYLLSSSFSSSSDKDIFALTPNYQVSIYFKNQGSVTCSIYWQNHYGIDIPHSSTPDSYFNFVANLTTTSQNLEILTQGGDYFIVCSGSSAGSYSIQTDPGPNARNQYIQFHSSGSSGGLGVNAFEVYGISNCSQAHNVCVSACDKKFIY
ncbi:hypothetical protein EHQ27_17810 [Leptospira wolffii]|uniref:hypothetical protein n=1 Tax=Leptospira wolffii TaxID=409998 RepID=UPI001083A120|nr:hypothetical protein [Leptospira wolffii]TGK62512.1 hypothetical protein EHQ32_06765 [Leptospira wolffii]TGK66055.1 hypothetical protein EHQ27_17810 [Leptospira wolffii]TGK74103.1 hypothetical protein EHQ35_07005 [Leptospira wolffii]TGL28962.1 hypothetical protein EHQ57_13525 [Leptospira wolffii]